MLSELRITHAWPAPIIALLNHAIHALSQGEKDVARKSFRAALKHEPNIPEAHLGLALAERPGPDYCHWLSHLHEVLKPSVYMEIGVETGRSLRLARPDTVVIGIDPEPMTTDEESFAAQTTICSMTSDRFFATKADDMLGGRHVDFAFIDGDHSFQQCLRDFIALEARMSTSGIIAIHDTWPLDAQTAAPVRETGFYTGDVWKIVPCLAALRPDLRLATLRTAPSGLTLVSGLDPSSRILGQRFDHIAACYTTLPYAPRLEHRLALQENTVQTVDRLLDRGHDVTKL